MYEKRLAEINARCAEIIAELEGEVTEERMTEIENEQRSLESEKAIIERKMNVRGRLGEPEAKPADGPTEDTAEERAKRVMETGKLSMRAAEIKDYMSSRSTLVATDSLAKPTKVGTDIRDNMEGISSIIDQVEVIDLTGCTAYEEAYVKTNPTASGRTDGQVNTPSDPEFRVAAIKPALINVTSYVSKNIKKVSPLAYEAKIKSLSLAALKRKVANLIVNGDGANFFGIKTAQNTKEEAISDTLKVTSATITATTLRDIVFSYGGNEELGPNARLFLTKEDLTAFGAVRGTNEKKAVYEITADPGNANCGTIKDGGTIVPYSLNSGLTSLSASSRGAADIPTMVYGDPKNFELGLFGDYEIEVSKDYKFAEGMLTIMGEVLVGGNVIVDKGFVVVTLAKAE